MTKDELRKHCERMCARYAEANRVTTCLTYEEHKLVLDLLDTDDVLTKALVIQALEEVEDEIDKLEDGISSYSNDRPWVYKDEVFEIIEQKIAEVRGKDCRDCKKWEVCECGKKGHENGTSIGYSIGECKEFEVNEVKGDKE